jgi:flagellar assembly protein FliH
MLPLTIMNDAIDSIDPEEEEFKAGSEDIEIKPWDLPYWRGGPVKDDAHSEVPETMEEEVEVVEPITVEELEAIRSEGYEEGFLQGLNEGREKGEAEGKKQGLIDGKEAGCQEGKQEGNRIGFEAGQAEGLAAGKEEITLAADNLAKVVKQLEQRLSEKDAALPQVLSQLIKTACETIIERELQQGDDQIVNKVTAALKQLPGGAENIQVFVSRSDAVYLEQGLTYLGQQVDFEIDDALVTGSARITTKQSLIEFSHQERMQKVFELIDSQCEKLDLTDIEGEQQEEPADEVVEETEIAESASEDVAPEEHDQEEDDEALDDDASEGDSL